MSRSLGVANGYQFVPVQFVNFNHSKTTETKNTPSYKSSFQVELDLLKVFLPSFFSRAVHLHVFIPAFFVLFTGPSVLEMKFRRNVLPYD